MLYLRDLRNPRLGDKRFILEGAADVSEKVFADFVEDRRQPVSDVGLDPGAGSPAGDDRPEQSLKKGA